MRLGHAALGIASLPRITHGQTSRRLAAHSSAGLPCTAADAETAAARALPVAAVYAVSYAAVALHARRAHAVRRGAALLHRIGLAWLPQIAEAAASFDSAAKLAPTLDEAWRNAGTAYQHLGQPDIAEGARAFAKFSARC